MNMTNAPATSKPIRPSRANAASKAEITDRTVRSILEAEALRREEKTARLRQARMEMEAARAKAGPKVQKAPAAKRRRG
jgi:hypothetical protein